MKIENVKRCQKKTGKNTEGEAKKAKEKALKQKPQALFFCDFYV